MGGDWGIGGRERYKMGGWLNDASMITDLKYDWINARVHKVIQDVAGPRPGQVLAASGAPGGWHCEVNS